MAVTVFMRYPDLSLEEYGRIMTELGLDANPPIGAILHVASEGVGGINVCEVWQTAGTAESYIEQRLRPLLEPHLHDPLSYRIEPLQNLFAPDINTIERIGAVSLPAHLPGAAIA
jgi:hypothetical protein